MNRGSIRRGVPIAVAVAVGLVIAGIAHHAGIRLVRVTSGSMEPTLSRGQFVVARVDDDMSGSDVGVGDIVLFRFPFGSASRAVKRVVAVDGDRVEVLPDAVVVDGHRLPAASPLSPDQPPLVAAEHELPAGTVFLLGDNAANSIDSRSFGALPERELAGRVVMTLPNDIGRIVLVLLLLVLASLALSLTGRRCRRPASGRWHRPGRGAS